MTAKNKLPSHAQVIIIGGGIMGCALVYHLAQEGFTDVILLEKGELTSGSTWHAAGQITHSTSSYTLGKMVDYNIGLYAGGLTKDTGQEVSWHGCGSLRLAYSADEMDWLRHTLSVGRGLGFEIELIDTARIAELHPFYNLDGVLGALHTPRDGHVDPSNVTQAFATGARARGVRILRQTRATGIKRDKNEWVVSTESGEVRGDIHCEHLVNAAGTYARQIGEWSGAQLPMTSMTHHYLVTEAVPEFKNLPRELPVIRDDARVSGYIRMERDSALIGIYEKENPRAVWLNHCPWELENELFTPDYERIMPWLENAMERMPSLANLGIKREVHGAISHPPDGNPLIGPVAGLRNYWCCCGTQIGIGWGPGLARELARWIVHGSADISMRDFDPRRFGDYANKDWQVVKAREDYCLRHEIPYPHFNRLAGRPIKPSPFYEVLRERGAVFEEVFGHERPRWFASGDMEARDIYGFRRTALFDIINAEVTAVRTRAGIMDITAFAKIELSGEGASVFLDGLIPNRLPSRDGGIILTHFLNRRGRVELETTILRKSASCFYLVCAAFFEARLLDLLAHGLEDSLANNKSHSESCEGQVVIKNLSDTTAALAINGPKAEAILARVTDTDLNLSAFPWLTAKQIKIAGKKLWALRLSYAGELGWELHIPNGAARAVYDALWQAGETHGLINYGSFAMNVMRLEKGFLGAGELNNEVTLAEAGVMRFVKLDKGDFVGREATLKSQAKPLPWICTMLQIESDGIFDGIGGEPVLQNGAVVGSLSSVAYSPTVESILALGYLKPSAARAGQKLKVLIAGEEREAIVSDKPAYDPENKKPRNIE